MNIHELPQDQKGTRAETLNIVNTWNASLVIYLATSLSTNTGNLVVVIQNILISIAIVTHGVMNLALAWTL